MAYHPSDVVLERYADVLVNFALGGGKGIARGDVVRVTVGEEAKPMYVALRNAVIRAGGTMIGNYLPSGIAREGIELASLEQLGTLHRPYLKGLAATVDHGVTIISTTDKQELAGVDPEKLTVMRRTASPFREWLHRKEDEGRYTWTLALYGTSAMAKEARLGLADYWEQIIQACYLDDEDPIARWEETAREIARLRKALDRLAIDRLHVEADGVDLHVGIGAGRRWLGGRGRNIPSFEIFTTPDFRTTEGAVRFTEPLYVYGALLQDVQLRFEKGVVVEAGASRGQDVLDAMLATDPGAARLGEFSLTDGRLSRITRFMAETLYDENRGGEQGNFHVAVGRAYTDAYDGDPALLKKRDWDRLGFNQSAVHTDIVSTARREVTATLPGGKRKVIYRDGRFTL